jgi:hypothetical protein
MSCILKAFISGLEIKKKKGWDYLYIAVDIHGTILKPNYSKDDIPREFYKNAKATLQLLSKMNSVKLIMFTSSWDYDIVKYNEYFLENDIKFDFFNENPDVPSEGFGCFYKKPYFNVLLDDKAGFDVDSEINDWVLLYWGIESLFITDYELYRESFDVPTF